VIDLRGTGQYGIYAGTSINFGTNNGIARNLTIRNGATTGSPQSGVFESGGGGQATTSISVSVYDSIIRDVTHPVVQMTPLALGATVDFTADHDDYDASVNVPAAGSLDPGQSRTETNLLNVDPLFVNPVSGVNGISGDYRPTPSSPVIDAGDATPLALGETDLAGQPRIVDGVSPFTGAVRDLGAYEFQPPQPASTPAPVSAPTGQQAAALKKCKKIKNPAKRRKCKKRAKRLPL
jgi:hypothetical protein